MDSSSTQMLQRTTKNENTNTKQAKINMPNHLRGPKIRPTDHADHPCKRHSTLHDMERHG